MSLERAQTFQDLIGATGRGLRSNDEDMLIPVEKVGLIIGKGGQARPYRKSI